MVRDYRQPFSCSAPPLLSYSSFHSLSLPSFSSFRDSVSRCQHPAVVLIRRGILLPPLENRVRGNGITPEANIQQNKNVSTETFFILFSVSFSNLLSVRDKALILIPFEHTSISLFINYYLISQLTSIRNML